MKSPERFTICMLMLSIFVLVACSGPSTPPTFVLTWVGPNGNVKNLESTDAQGWRRGSPDPQATTLTGNIGPAIAHDGNFTWMLMWVNGPELQYKVGVGGATGTDGISWEQNPNIGKLPVHPNASPALAYGNNRWVVVFRRAGGRLFVVRSQEHSDLDWETPIDLIHQDVTPQPATTTRAPAMVFGTFDAQELFVLVYVHPNMGAVAATSPDGVTWSPPVSIAPAEKDPALAARNGRLYALLSRQVSTTGAASGYHSYVFKSCNGANWSQIGTYPRSANNSTGAGMAYGACKLIVTEQIGGALGGNFIGISARTGTPTGPCDDPTAFSIGNDRAVSLDLVSIETVGNRSARTAVAFADTRSPSSTALRCPGSNQRRLQITEWFPEMVELYLDEPSDTTLDLAGLFLDVSAKVDLVPNVDEPNYSNRANLTGTMTGGSFLIVFEQYGYTGPPVSETFIAPGSGREIPGIKVEQGFFGWNMGGTSTSLRVSGTSASQNLSVDDVLKIGGRPRPVIGGAFTEDTPTPVSLPLAPGTMGRRWGPNGPIDNDLESDWSAGPRSFGEPTP